MKETPLADAFLKGQWINLYPFTWKPVLTEEEEKKKAELYAYLDKFEAERK